MLTRMETPAPTMASPCLKLVLCCLPCYGHAKPLVILAELLADHGHEVMFVTSQTMVPHIKTMCKDPRVNVLGLEDSLIPESDNFMLGRPAHVKLHPVFFAQAQMNPPLLALIKSMSPLPDMMISDHLTWAGLSTARTLGIRHAAHVTWPLHMLEECGYLPPRSLSSLVGMTVRALRGSRLAPSFLKPPGPPRAFLKGVRKQCLGVGVGGEIGAGLEGGGLVLVTSSFGIEPPRPLPPCVKLIGRGHRPETVDTLQEHAELKAFLDAHDVVVYVTFGSRVRPSPSLVRTVGDALVGGGWAVAWSLKAADAAHLPQAALASGNFFVRPWLPQAAALAHPHIKAAVIHCGMGGLFECTVNAIPVVPIPFLLSADQPVNARAAERAGFASRPRPSRSGLGLIQLFKRGDPEYTPSAIRDAVSKAVEDPALSKAAQRVKRAVLSAGYGRVAVDAVESACLYGTDHMVARGSENACSSSAAQTLWGFAGGLAVGALLAGVAGYVAASGLASGGSTWGSYGIGKSCRVR